MLREKRKFAIEEVRKRAYELGLPTVNVVQWLKQRGVVVEESNSISHFTPATQKLMKRRCSRFFDSLPYEKKIVLLRKIHKSLKHSSRSMRELAAKLNLPQVQLFNWMHHHKRRYLARDQLLTAEIIEVLTAEFKKCDYWDEEHIMILSNRLNVAFPLIKKWYSDQRAKNESLKKTDTANVSIERRGRGEMKTAWQKAILFEEFKKSPGAVTSETISKLRETTKLNAMQISKWLSCIRVKWAQSNIATVKKNLTKNLTKEELVVLERQYRQCRFLDNDIISGLKNAKLHNFALKAWFSNRRIYEVLTNDKDLVAVDVPKNKRVVNNVNEQSENLKESPEEPPSIAVVKNENKIFFDSLSKNQKQRLMKSVNFFNLSYNRLAHSLNLPVDQVRNWMVWKRQQNKLYHKINFPDHVVRTLRARYEQNKFISKSETIALAEKVKLQPSQVKTWFVNRRRYERIHPTIEQSVPYQAQPAPPESEIKTEQKEITEMEPSVKEVNLQSKHYRKDIVQNNILFDEFRKSRELSISRINTLSSRLRLTPMQVRKWFYNFNKSYNFQTDEKILKGVENETIGVEKLTVLVSEFCKSRYISAQRMEQLAEQIGMSSALIKRWFSSARWYEVRFGHVPGVSTLPLPVQNSSHSTQIVRYKRLLGTGKITQKKLQILKKEFLKDEIMTNERAKILCSKVKLSMERIKSWFENRRKLKAEKEEIIENVAELPVIEIAVPKVSNKINATSLEKVQSDVVQDDTNDEKIEVSHLPPDLHSTPYKDKKNYNCKMPIQQNKLFEEFKKSSSLPNQRLVQLTKELGLLDKQISAWFHWMRSKLSTLSKKKLTEEYRNKNLNSEQIAMLELEYQKNRYISRERREELSTSLQVSKSIIKTWFANKRYYEILCDSEASETFSQPEKIESPEIEEESEVGMETVIDYDWEDENNLEFIKTEASDISNIDFKIENIPVNNEQDNDADEFPLEETYSTALQDESDEESSSPFNEDYNDTIFQSRERFITPLAQNLEPIDQDLDVLLWFMSKTPNQNNQRMNSEIDEYRDQCLDLEFQKNPWPTLDKIALLSQKLNVSEPKIHWWFMKKRCFLTKTILTVPPTTQKTTKLSKSLVIDLTDDEARNAQCLANDESNSQEPEFIALDDSEIKIEEFVDENLENDVNTSPLSEPNLENGEFNNCENETSLPCEYNLNDMSVHASTTDATQDMEVSKKIKKSSQTGNINKKKTKIPLTSHQRAILLREFKRCKFLSAGKARLLAQDLSLSVNRVDSWFEYMRSNAEKKINPVEKAPVSLDKLTPTAIESLEAEYQRSQNLSEKRAKMIALKLNIKRREVRQWFFERINKKDAP